MKSKLKAYDFSQAESGLIGGDKETRSQIKNELLTRKARLDYFMTRFLEDHGDNLDCPKRNAFYQEKTDEYSKINRLIRIANAYS
jgi:hypothetical protein